MEGNKSSIFRRHEGGFVRRPLMHLVALQTYSMTGRCGKCTPIGLDWAGLRIFLFSRLGSGPHYFGPPLKPCSWSPEAHLLWCIRYTLDDRPSHSFESDSMPSCFVLGSPKLSAGEIRVRYSNEPIFGARTSQRRCNCRHRERLDRGMRD